MKKFKLPALLLVIFAMTMSCNMINWDDVNDLSVTADLYTKVPRLYPGGNVECSQLNEASISFSTGRNNYSESTNSFESSWPTGLVVNVREGKYVDFAIDGALTINGKCYKVAAVIVKGSAASNVYNYTELGGVTGDKNLTPPTNSSGGPAGLSNLTFCFIECKDEPKVIVVKSWYWLSNDSYENSLWDDYKYTMSTGTNVYSTGGWCDLLGINYYPGTSGFSMTNNAGTVTVEEGWPDGVHSLIITVDLNDGYVFDNTSLFVGSMAELEAGPSESNGCPVYPLWPYQKNTKVNTHVFTIPY